MKNFVISLACANERHEHITSEFSKHGIAFSFFNAITPDLIDQVAKDVSLDITHADLKHCEVACLLSQVVLWQKAVDENLDFVGIFEDDIHLGQQAEEILTQTDWIPDDAHIIKIEAFYPKATVSMRSKSIFSSNRKLVELRSKHMGAGGYILSYQGAKALLHFIKEYKTIIPIDHILFKDYLMSGEHKVYQMLPALCVQDFILMSGKTSLPSYLAQERKLRKGNISKVEETLTLKEKFTKEFRRFLAQLIRFRKAEYIVKIKFR